MQHKKSLIFYNKYIKNASLNKLFLCRAELLFRNYIIPNIEVQKLPIRQLQIKLPKLYIFYLVLALQTLSNILILKFKKIDKAHYLIDVDNNANFYDLRSKEILEISPLNSYVNFMHVSNLKYSLTSLNKKTNAIYFETIYYVLKPFLKPKRFEYEKGNNNFANEVLEAYQDYYSDSFYIYKVTHWILNFLKIRTLFSIDDTRYSNEINLAARDLNIKSIGYMHGRFNEYHLGIFEFPFNKYLVWSNYFKNKLLENSNKYNQNDIEVVGHHRIKEGLNDVIDRKNILWLGESNLNYKEIEPFIDNTIANGYKVYFRGKPGTNESLSDFIKQKNIILDASNSFFESLSNNNIGLVLGTHSTALLESWLVGVPSLALKCSYDYGSHLWEDGLIELCEDINSLSGVIERHIDFSKKHINENRKKIWGESFYFNKNKVIRILTKNDNKN